MKLLACLCNGGRKKKRTPSSVQQPYPDAKRGRSSKSSRAKDGEMAVFAGAAVAVAASTGGGCGGGGGGGCGGGGCGGGCGGGA
jgi:hypothetical protein